MIKKAVRRAARTLPLVSSRVAGAAITGGLAVYVARTEGAEASGRFFYFVSTITILSVLTRLGAEPFLSARVAPRAKEGASVTLRYLLATMASVTLTVGGAVVILGLLSLASGNFASTVLGDVSLWELGVSVLGLNTVWVAGGYCRAIGLASLSIFIETGLFSLWLLAVLESSRLGSFDASPSVLAVSVALLFPVLSFAFLPMLIRAGRAVPTVAEVREAFVGIVSFGAVTITNGIVILIPLQVLGLYGLDHDAGVYNAALRVSMFVGAFGVVIKSVVVRSVALGVNESGGRMNDVRQSAIIAVPWILVSVLISSQGELPSRLFGDDFAELQSIILPMLVAQCIYVAGNLIETRAVLAGERALLNLTSLATLVTAIAVTPPLVSAYELAGAVWGFVVTIVASRTLLATMYIYNGRRASRTPLLAAQD